MGFICALDTVFQFIAFKLMGLYILNHETKWIAF